MPKYRTLNTEELRSLEKEFIDFLILNGIPAAEWVKIKEDQTKAQTIIDSFSDVVFEKILRELRYLDHYSPKSIKTFFCDQDQIYLVGLDTESEDIDLTTEEGIKRLQTSPPADLQVYRTSKSYHPSREEELFKMLQQGCQKSDGSLYESLSSNSN